MSDATGNLEQDTTGSLLQGTLLHVSSKDYSPFFDVPRKMDSDLKVKLVKWCLRPLVKLEKQQSAHAVKMKHLELFQ